MIKLIYDGKRLVGDEYLFPTKHFEVTLEDDDDIYTLLYEVVQLARVATHYVTKNVWEKAGEFIEDRDGFEESALESDKNSWFFDNDITYCMDECDNTFCMRNRDNLKPGDIYSMSYLKGTNYCPLFRKGEDVND